MYIPAKPAPTTTASNSVPVRPLPSLPLPVTSRLLLRPRSVEQPVPFQIDDLLRLEDRKLYRGVAVRMPVAAYEAVLAHALFRRPGDHARSQPVAGLGDRRGTDLVPLVVDGLDRRRIAALLAATADAAEKASQCGGHRSSFLPVVAGA